MKICERFRVILKIQENFRKSFKEIVGKYSSCEEELLSE